MERCPHRGLPDLTFLAFAVAHQHVDSAGIAVQLLSERHAGSGGKTLSERAGGKEHAGEMVCHSRMSLESCAETAESGEFADREVAGARENAVVDRGEMSCRDDEHILSLAFTCPCLRVVTHFTEIQRGHHVRDAERAARVPGFRRADHPDDVATYLRGGFLQCFDIGHS